jgi:hypothetical protein
MTKVVVISLFAALAVLPANAAEFSTLRDALVFHAPFDETLDAAKAPGDKTLYWAPKVAFPPEARPGLPPDGLVIHEKSGGVTGGCLLFTRKASEQVFFKARGNMPYRTSNWSGAVSLWLRLTPDEDLAPGFTDPIQITSKSWDDAAFFIEFSKDENPRELRLGAYADKHVWNPSKRDWNSIPMSEKPLIPVIRPPFTRDGWTHVAFNFQNYNTGQTNAVTTLFINGVPRGSLSPREQTFTWDLDQTLIMLGLSYVGRLDELAIFNRALEPAEITALHSNKGRNLR